jgi:CheY-like chemotaxis protein
MTVFVIDDNALHLKLCKVVLEKKGHDVYLFKSIEELNNFYGKNRNVIPHIFFIDYRLGVGVTGLDVLNLVKERYKWDDTKCIAFTADVSEASVLAKKDFDTVLLKPVTNEILTTIVGKYSK